MSEEVQKLQHGDAPEPQPDETPRRPRRRLLTRVITRQFLPEDLRNDHDARRTAQRVLQLALLAIPLYAALAAGSYLLHRSPRLALLVGACGALTCLTPWVLRWTRSPRTAGHWLTGCLWLLLSLELLFFGEFPALATHWLALAAPCGMLVAGRRSGWAWAIASLATLFAGLVLHGLGLLPAHEVSGGQIAPSDFATAMVTVAVGAYLFSLLEEQRRTALCALALERARLEHWLSHDQLTGLPNRRQLAAALRAAVSRACEHGSRFALLHLDLDGFKAINDRLGRSAGDALLVKVAERLASITRTGHLLARLADDEFVVLIDEVGGRANAEFVARRVHQTLRRPFSLMGTHAVAGIQVGSSHGLALFPEDGREPDELLRAADAAMCRAKAMR